MKMEDEKVEALQAAINNLMATDTAGVKALSQEQVAQCSF